MPLLKVDDILNNRNLKLKSVVTTPTLNISFNSGLPPSSVTTLSTPPGKRIFSIVSWNVQDYKGDKMSNPFVNQFISLVSEKLSVDLLILIETDYDLTELAANIEDADPTDFGDLFLNPPSPPKDEDWSDITDPVKQKQHLEKMAEGLPKYTLFASEIAHRRFDLPKSFTGSNLQSSKFTGSGFNEHAEMLAGLKPCYTVTDKKKRFVANDYDSLILAAKNKPSDFMKKIAPDIVFDLIKTCGNCKGVASGVQNCIFCGGSGNSFGSVCKGCEGKGQRKIVCSVCEGTGSYSSESESRVIQLLREIVNQKTVPKVDTETYTMFWRKSDSEVSSKFTISSVPAPNEKAVWLNSQGCGLVSTDEKGNELGYQNPKSKFNSRSPYVIPLVISIDRTRYFVPMAVLHTIWGTKAADKQGRVESVLKMFELGVLNGTERVKMGSTKNFILLGDLNLDYDPGSGKNDYHAKAYEQIKKLLSNTTGNKKDYILPIIGGTKSAFTTFENVNKKGLDDETLYTNAYDQFLIAQSSELYPNIVNGGVIDVISLLEDEISKNLNLQTEIDKDMAQFKNSKGVFVFDLVKNVPDDKFRAFYIYRKYISDHLPIILDILVDETSPEEKQLVEEQKKLSFFAPPPKIQTISYFGVWQSLASSTNMTDELKAGGGKVEIVGNITGIISPDCLVISATDSNAQIHSFVGKFDLKSFDIKNFRIGQRVQGICNVAKEQQHTQVDAVFFNGKWSKLENAAVQKYVFSAVSESKNASVAGTIIAILSPNQINIEIPYTETKRRIFQGKVNGANLSNLKIGDWLAGTFDFD